MRVNSKAARTESSTNHALVAVQDLLDALKTLETVRHGAGGGRHGLVAAPTPLDQARGLVGHLRQSAVAAHCLHENQHAAAPGQRLALAAERSLPQRVAPPQPWFGHSLREEQHWGSVPLRR